MCLGCGSTAVVQSAVCTANNEKVAIKRIDLDKYTGSIEELQVCQGSTNVYTKGHTQLSPFSCSKSPLVVYASLLPKCCTEIFISAS